MACFTEWLEAERWLSGWQTIQLPPLSLMNSGGPGFALKMIDQSEICMLSCKPRHPLFHHIRMAVQLAPRRALLDWYMSVVGVVGFVFLFLSCIEVGSNDATNLVNAVFGSQVLDRKRAVIIAGVFVVLGATFSSPVMDTVRKGIFDLGSFDAHKALAVFISAYLVSTILLYTFSLFGMPVSTTATLVFCLAGGAAGVLGLGVVNSPVVGKVVAAIVMSILISGTMAFYIQRAFRGAIRRNASKHDVVMLHGPWITGTILVALGWFMVLKGMKHVSWMKPVKSWLADGNTPWALLGAWFTVTVLTYAVLLVVGRRATKYLFHFTAILGMACMAFAFGQNDLANCASPGVAILMILSEGLGESMKMSVPLWALAGCGFLMFCGMLTKRAHRVTQAEVHTASQRHQVTLYAPAWCRAAARAILKLGNNTVGQHRDDIAPKDEPEGGQDGLHYDALRASVILAVSACVIAVASSMGLPVSTTYVAFAAVVASGWGDRVYSRGHSDLKIGRTIWVVFGWFASAAVAFIATAGASSIVDGLKIPGLTLLLLTLVGIKLYSKSASDRHEVRHHASPRASKPPRRSINATFVDDKLSFGEGKT